MGVRHALIAIAVIGLTPTLACASSADRGELPIETILAQHTKLNGTIVRFRGVLVSGGMGNVGVCTYFGRGSKCLWLGGTRIFDGFRERSSNPTRFIVEGRVNDECIRQQCTDLFSQIEDAIVIGQY
jgi:hypothetical protein